MALERVVPSLHPVAIALSGTDAGQIAVPVKRFALADLDPGLLARIVE